MKKFFGVWLACGFSVMSYGETAKDYIVFKGLPKYENAATCADDLEAALKRLRKVIQVKDDEIEGRCREFKTLDKTYVWHLKLNSKRAEDEIVGFSEERVSYPITESRKIYDIKIDKFGELYVDTQTHSYIRYESKKYESLEI